MLTKRQFPSPLVGLSRAAQSRPQNRIP